MKHVIITSIVALVTLGLTALPLRAQKASFSGIGFLPDGGMWSNAWAVSTDGAIVGGQAFTSTTGGGMRWQNGQMELLPGLGIAFSISDDGRVAVGESGGFDAVRWADGKATVLDPLPGATVSTAWDVSADGAVVVGTSGNRPFRWEDDSTHALPLLPGNETGEARAVSADGRLVAGSSGGRSVRWVNGVPKQLPPPGSGLYFAQAISADGRAIVGFFATPQGGRSFLWREGESTITLPPLASDSSSTVQAEAISGDGRLVAGVAGLYGAFFWTEETGTRLLKDYLVERHGLDLTGWFLVSTGYNGISYDGTVLVGEGYNPQGEFEGWRAVLPPWPVAQEPEAPEATVLTLSVLPNPVRSHASVRLMLPEPSQVRVTVTDVLGREVARVHEGTLAAGWHTFSFAASGLAAGVYVMRAATAWGAVSERVTVLR